MVAKLTEAVFWALLQKQPGDGCWVHPNRPGPGGYVTVSMEGTRWKAHRLAYTLARGAVPDDLLVCHRCDNPPCCRPDHLFVGTHLDNKADQRAKGRTLTGERNPAHQHPERLLRGEVWRRVFLDNPNRTRGERHPNARFTEEAIRQIRREYAAGGVSMAALARRHAVVPHAMQQIIRRQTWKHVAAE